MGMQFGSPAPEQPVIAAAAPVKVERTFGLRLEHDVQAFGARAQAQDAAGR
jgi:hypothetical protein